MNRHFHESIHVKADFTAEPSSGEAPLDVVFTDKSVRASTYLWEFGTILCRCSVIGIPQVLYSRRVFGSADSGERSPCVDSMRLNYIVVEESALDIPNVFTPNGDGSMMFYG